MTAWTVLAVLLAVLIVFALAWAVVQFQAAGRSAFAEQVLGERRAGPRGRPRRGAGRGGDDARRRAAARRFADEEPLPWPFSLLDNLQRLAGERQDPQRIAGTVVVGAAGMGIAAQFFVGVPVVTALAACAGIMAPVWLLQRKAAQRLAVIEDQVSGVCLQIAQAVTAGQTVDQAFGAVAQRFAAPLGDELRRVWVEAQVEHVPLEAAVGRLAQRLPGAPSVSMLAATLQISIEMGADMAEQLDRIAEVVRQRRISTARVRGTVAMARLQSKVLFFLPLLAFVWVKHGDPAVVAGFTGTPAGQLKLVGMTLWLVFGYFVSQGILASAFGGVL